MDESFYPKGEAGQESQEGVGSPTPRHLVVLPGHPKGGEQETVQPKDPRERGTRYRGFFIVGAN